MRTCSCFIILIGGVGSFTLDGLSVGSRPAIAQEVRSAADWEARFPGIKVKLDAMGYLQVADFSKCTFPDSAGSADAALAFLPQQSKLRNLTLSGRGLSKVGIGTVAKCENLGALSILDGPIGDDELAALRSLTKLKELSLVRLEIGNRCLAPFVNNPSLTKLRVRGAAGVTDQTIAEYLPNFANLVSLELSELAIGDASLDTIAKLPKLSELNLLRTRVTNAGLKKLAGLSLKKLNLDDIATIGDEAIPAILAIPTLEFLHLGKTKVTDQGVAELSGLKNLKDLLINDTAVSEKALAELQAKLPDLKIKSK
ncbi:Leucine Rich repeats (2 copies) [Pirellula sp. SH-Sr6A]|uniref:hypothetical protein n=1 Tax=Pirellula sp. SH-Sr6A TaxID=1632865 RepID=UPI00078DF7B1|nr:hypothetical protein [Pirellula sp. SH-Sr6A]AMV33160.1 Leucine Rich repeats (2 copies) [Pirellula sp. SH-Sr6A]